MIFGNEWIDDMALNINASNKLKLATDFIIEQSCKTKKVKKIKKAKIKNIDDLKKVYKYYLLNKIENIINDPQNKFIPNTEYFRMALLNPDIKVILHIF